MLIRRRELLAPGYQQIDHVYCEGGSNGPCIFTNIRGDQYTLISVNAAITKPASGTNAHIFGDLSDSTQAISFNLNPSTASISRYGSETQAGLSQYVDDGVRNTYGISSTFPPQIRYSKNTVVLWHLGSAATRNFTTSRPISIMAATAGSSFSTAATGYLYEAEVRKIAKVGLNRWYTYPVARYVPCIQLSTGYVGVYDSISGVFDTGSHKSGQKMFREEP